MAQLITTTLVTTKPKKRTKVFDTKCKGFYVSITPGGVATFALQYWHIKLGKQKQVTIGIYSPDGWTVEKARAKALDMSSRAGLGQPIDNEVKLFQASVGATVSVMIDDFIAFISADEVKADGGSRPVVETWKDVASYLNRDVRPAIGFLSPSDVTNNEIAAIQERAEKRGPNAGRLVRSAMKGLFKFGATAGTNSRKYGLTSSPVHNLPTIKGTGRPKTRVLDEDEIRTLWWGLEHPGLPSPKQHALALKFILVSMLRPREVRSARRSRIAERNTKTPVLNIEMKFVKKRRPIAQPLNSLAVEITERMSALHDHDLIFTSDTKDGAMLNRVALSEALNSTKKCRVGIIEFLGMKHFTPYDLRRTAATLCGDIGGISDADIAKCLDHQKGGDRDTVEAPSVTKKHYNHSKRLIEKRAVLDKLDKELRRIIGKRPAVLPCARRLKLAA